MSIQRNAPAAKRDNVGGVVVVLCIVVFIGIVWLISNGSSLTSSSAHTVTYAVTDSSGSGATSVTFMSDGGIKQRAGASLPFSEDAFMSSGQPLVMNAQRAGSDSGTITCTISVDGAEVQTSDGSGPYALCQASTVL